MYVAPPNRNGGKRTRKHCSALVSKLERYSTRCWDIPIKAVGHAAVMRVIPNDLAL